jgi:preprotein translocase subunit YajC
MTTDLALLAATTAKKSSGSFTFLIIIVVGYALVYFLFLRPRQQKAKAQRTQARAVEVGDKIQTIGGLIGTIVAMDERTVTVRADSGTELQFLRQAIQGRFVEPTEPAVDDDAGEHEDGGN